MIQLSDVEAKKVLEKLYKYVGENVKLLLDRPDGKYCLRAYKRRVFYVSEKVLKLAENVSPDHFASCGTCLGKFTKTNAFYLSVTALQYLAPFAQYKVWVKPGAEQQFLYGNNILKSGLGRITENTPKNQGVVVYSMSDIPLGFGLATKSTAECKHAVPTTLICINQADIGQYLRSEDTLI